MILDSQQMFMLFFSILYGIMLNSLIGRGAFPITSALAREDLIGFDEEDEPIWDRGWKSARRFGLSILINNFFPMCYFAISFLSLEYFIGPTIDSFPQILSIGLLSLSVFSFSYIYLGLTMIKLKGRYLFYTDHEFKKFMKKRRTIYKGLWEHIIAGALYKIVPWLVILFFRATGILP